MIESSDTDYVLFLVPFQTKKNLHDEIKKWNFSLPYRIEGVESLSNSDRLYLELREEVGKHMHPFVVVDESLKIKNIHANRTKRIMDIGKGAYYKIVLNGTPISKNVLDIYTQLEFLSPKILNMSYYEFLDTFIAYTVNYYPHYQFKVDGNCNIDYLYSLIKPYVFESKLSLGIGQHDHEITYMIDNRAAYYQAKDTMLGCYGDMGDLEFLATTQKMQHSYSLDTGKIRALDDLMEDIHGSTILFCKYVQTKAELSQRYPQCLVITYGKGSLGLNLQDYQNIIFVDKTWDYAQLEQAKRRIYRTGQGKEVNFYYMTGDVGLEKLMDKSIKGKTTILDLFKSASMKKKRKEFINGI